MDAELKQLTEDIRKMFRDYIIRTVNPMMKSGDWEKGVEIPISNDPDGTKLFNEMVNMKRRIEKGGYNIAVQEVMARLLEGLNEKDKC
jgi:hypothetical protein